MTIHRSLALLALCGVAACTAPAPEPTPPPVQRPTQPAATPPGGVTLPTPENWMDAPQTAGDWQYRAEARRAVFFAPGNRAVLTLDCDPSRRNVTIARMGSASGRVPMRILTETQVRLLEAAPVASPEPAVAASLAAHDGLLDAMALSKGRFAVEASGMETVYLPSWPEVTRVIEDCR